MDNFFDGIIGPVEIKVKQFLIKEKFRALSWPSVIKLAKSLQTFLLKDRLIYSQSQTIKEPLTYFLIHVLISCPDSAITTTTR